MQFQFLSGPAAQAKLKELIGQCVDMQWAVAWATDNEVLRTARKQLPKLKRLVIGTHYYVTSPQVLQRLAHLDTVRVMLHDGHLFHPKVYFFRMPGQVAAVLGSHNLTDAAFEKNIEASVLVTGDGTEKMFGDLGRFLERMWEQARPIDAAFLGSYRAQHRRNQHHRDELTKFRLVPRPKSKADNESPLDLDWPEFVRRIRQDPHHDFNGRLRILHAAAKFFREEASLAKMKREIRRQIAGTQGKSARKEMDWGWFGQMSGFGGFAHQINESPGRLSQALDHIPLFGAVTPEHYAKYIRTFSRAFVGEKRKGRLGTATRLLAMKRPDYFVCLNDANRTELCLRFGSSVSNVTLESYWEKIVEPIMSCPWWGEPQPSHPGEAAIWRGRAALLDVIYYKPA